MKRLNKLVSAFLAAAVLVSCLTALSVRASAAAEELPAYDVPVVAADFEGDTVAFYEKDGKYYIDAHDAALLAGFSAAESDDGLVLTRGIRTETAKDGGGSIKCIAHQGALLCEAVPTLEYLGAACSAEKGYLAVYATGLTIWDAAAADLSSLHAITRELHGDDELAFLTMDLLLDYWDLNDDAVHDKSAYYQKKALYEILDAEPLNYASAQAVSAAQNKRNENAFSWEKVQKYADAFDQSQTAVTDPIDKYAGFLLKYYIRNQGLVKDDLVKKGLTADADEIALKIEDATSKQALANDILSGVSKFVYAAKFGLGAASIYLERTSYSDETRNLYLATAGKNALAYMGLDAPAWAAEAGVVYNEVDRSSVRILGDAAVTSATDCTVEFLKDLTFKVEMKLLDAPAECAVYGKQISDAVTHAVFSDVYKGFSGDIEAIFVREVQVDAYKMVGALLTKLADSKNGDGECLAHLKSALALFYRSVIAYSEDAKLSVKANGGSDAAEWIAKFDARADEAAGYLYKLNACEIAPVPDYASLTDDVLTADWMAQFLSAVKNNGGTAVGWRGGVYYWKYTAASVADTGVTGAFQQKKSVSNTLVRRGSDGKEAEIYKGPGFGKIFVSGGRLFFEASYASWACVNADGSDRKELPGVKVAAADARRGLVVCSSVNDGSLTVLDKNLKSTPVGGGAAAFLALGGGTLYYGKESGSKLTVYASDLTGNAPGEPKSLGVIETGVESGKFMVKDISAHLGTAVLFVACGGMGGSGFVYSDGGLSAVALDGSGVRTLVKPGSADSLQYDEFFVANAGEGADKETVYYYRGGDTAGTSTFFSDMAPWIDHGVYKIDPISGTISPSDEYLTPDGSFVCKDGAVLARLGSGPEYTEVASADTLKAAGYENVGVFGNGRVCSVSNFAAVGDTVYMEVQIMDRDNSLNMGWRPGFRRVNNRLFAVKPGSPMTLIYEY